MQFREAWPRAPFAACVVLLAAASARAEVSIQSANLDAEVWTAVDEQQGDVALARLRISPEIKLRLGGRWRAEASLRGEFSDDDTGLGTRDTYDSASRPASFGDHARIELERAVLTWRKRSTVITLGKQSVPWGLLDGLQVTDRFDAVRRRDAIFTERRPERLGRWGARAQFKRGATLFDLAVASDGTVNQFARAGETYFPQASRLRGGIDSTTALPSFQVDLPESATVGMRVSRQFGASDIGVLAFHGPDTEPVFRLGSAGATLRYPDRTLVGATWQRASGPRVWRVEVAHIPNQAVNVALGQDLDIVSRDRWLAGLALDWKAGSVFINAQIAVDQVSANGATLVRPSTDWITTLRAQKSFANDRLTAHTELIASLSDGDAAFRPGVTWQWSDALQLSAGLDWAWGDREGLFGQYKDQSRLWLRARMSF